jgi:tetratricopeptide (TPR) repeat protein
MSSSDEVGMVKHYLKGQNLEQLGRIDDAIAQYEKAVEGLFDSTGPYERLIFLYADLALHKDVMRVADAALENVRTYSEKKQWYRTMRMEAEKRLGASPRPIARPTTEQS